MSNCIEESVRYKSLAFMGLDYYRVGTDGSVWSRRVKGNTDGRFGPWWRLKPGRGERGHLIVGLYVRGTAKCKTYRIHQLVLFAFVGPRPEGMECRHLDGNKTNNRLSNLKWGTRKENAEDCVKHGHQIRGERLSAIMRKVANRGRDHWNCKTTEGDVRNIRLLYKQKKLPMRKLADMHNISLTAVHSIIHRKGWKHVS